MSANLTVNEIKTKDFYNNNAKEWLNGLAVGGDNLLFESELLDFKKLLHSGNILEIGSGIGNDAKWFIENGYKYTGIDISSEMVTLSRSRVKEGTFQEMSVYSLDFPDNTFDGFWTSITLLHIPKNNLEIALKEIFRVIKKDGIGFISMKEGEGEKYEDSKQRFYAYYSQEEFVVPLINSGFEVISTANKFVGKTSFLIFFVRKSK